METPSLDVCGVVECVDDLFDDGRGHGASPTRMMLVATKGGRLEIKIL